MDDPRWRAGPARCAALRGPATHPSLFGLAPCGVYPASGVAAGAVRSYRTFSPLPSPLPKNQRGGIFSVALAVSQP
jgi:hypothetical protein